MSEKRKDKRGRILHDGETQNADGRYRYSYTENGERKQIYSWKLVTTDPLPKGRRECIALRDQEEQIRKTQEIRDQYTSTGMTVFELVKWYTENRKGVRNTTKAGYKTVCNILENDAFGKRKIDSVKSREAKEWLVKLQKKDGRSYHSIHTIRGVLNLYMVVVRYFSSGRSVVLGHSGWLGLSG